MTSFSIFNELGLQLFKEFIDSKGVKKLPNNILTDDLYSDFISPDTQLNELKIFEDRLDMAKYLDDVLDSEIFEKYDNEPKFWSWLCCLYIEQIALNGKYNKPEHYIYSPGRVVYRHSVATSVRSYRQHGYTLSRMLISRKINTWPDIAEQVFGRQYLTRSKDLLKFIEHLYYDKNTDDLKLGSASRINNNLLKSGTRSKTGSGGMRRLTLQLRRLALNYKVDAMSVDNISPLLPSEYDKFICNNEKI
jgi:hypothetical protein